MLPSKWSVKRNEYVRLVRLFHQLLLTCFVLVQMQEVNSLTLATSCSSCSCSCHYIVCMIIVNNFQRKNKNQHKKMLQCNI